MGAVRSSSASREEHVFFVYDRDALKSEWDDPETAILFFCPSTVGIDEQCSLCGQLIGMVSFVEGLLDVKPKIFRLKNGKFAVKCVANYVMALGGKLTDPDNLLFKLLTDLHGVFQFFHKSLESVVQESQDLTEVKKKMVDIWHCYVPFIKHYRQDMLTFFDTIQYMDFNKAGSFTYLKAMQVLEACQRRTKSLCGCILSKQRIVTSQVQPDILRFLSFIKPGQDHLPVPLLDLGGNVPGGVQIFPVYVCKSAYLKILDVAHRTPYSLIKKRKNESKLSDADSERKSAGTRLGTVENFLSNISKSMSLGRSLPKTTDSETTSQTGNSLSSFNFSEDNDSGVVFKGFNRFAKINKDIIQDNREPSNIRSPSTFGYSHNFSNKSDSSDSLCKPKMETFDESEIDAVLEKQFGGQLEDLRESVKNFNLCYENSPKPDSEKSSSRIGLSYSSWAENRVYASNDDEVAFNAYKRTYEYIKSCIENTDSEKIDEEIPDLEKERTRSGLESRCSDVSNGPEIEFSKEKEIVNSESSISIDTENDIDINKKILNSDSNRGTDVDTEEDIISNARCEKTTDSTEKSVISTASSEYKNSKLTNDEDIDREVESELILPGTQSNFKESDSDVVTPTNTNQLFSPKDDGTVESSEVLQSKFVINGTELDTLADEDGDKEVEEINFKQETTLEWQDENQKSEKEVKKTLTGLLSENIKRQKVVENEVSLSGDDGYASMERDLDRQRREVTENQMSADEKTKINKTEKGEINKEDDGLKMLHLYVQAHSNTVLMVLLEPQLEYDVKMLRSMYETVVPHLGDIEISVQRLLESSEENRHNDEFVYMMYNGDQKKHSGNCKFISQKDYAFGRAMESLHSQFTNSETMIDATFRDYTTAIYGKRTHLQETYYQPRGNYKPTQGTPTPYDSSFVLDRRINSKLRKDKAGIVL